MARILQSRNIILSLVDLLRPYVVSYGYDFTFVPSWRPDHEIVLPKDYDETKNQIKLPAGKISVLGNKKSGHFEIGNKYQYNMRFINIFMHAVSEGQILDLLDLFDMVLSQQPTVDIYDFSETGYPSITTPPVAHRMNVEDVSQRLHLDPSNENAALRYGGLISFTGRIIGFQDVTTTSTTTTP